MWYSETLGLIKTPRAITVDEVQHPANIFRVWSKAELDAIGFKPARIESVDQKHYDTGAESFNLVDGEWVISYAATPKALDVLKTTMKSEVSNIASTTLVRSDWMTHRESEGGKAMSADWKTYRSNIRAISNIKEAEIDALADLDAVKAYSVNSGWPNDPDYVEE